MFAVLQGFHFSRPPAGTPGNGVRLNPNYRTPFIPMDPLQKPDSWNYGCVLTTGGPAIVGDNMYMYASGSTGPVTGGLAPHRWEQSMGLAVLRRDGFASISPRNRTIAMLITRYVGAVPV